MKLPFGTLLCDVVECCAVNGCAGRRRNYRSTRIFCIGLCELPPIKIDGLFSLSFTSHHCAYAGSVMGEFTVTRALEVYPKAR
jgi:hypothetical protein